LTRILRASIVVVILFALTATAFASAGTVSEQVSATSTVTTDPTTFVKATIGQPDFLDPAVDYEQSGWEVLQNVYETLVWYDGASAATFVPLLAKEVPSAENGLISTDGLEYVFNLKEGVKFHDGTVMNADDVVYSIQRVLRIHEFSSMAWMLEQVMTDYLNYYLGRSVSEYLAQTNHAPWITAVLEPLGADHLITEEDVQAVAEVVVLKTDDMSVKFRLTHPYSGFLSILSTTVGSIVSKEFVEAHGGVVNGLWNEYMLTHTCGSGPYQLASWDIDGGSLVLSRFNEYHGNPPSISTVYVLVVDDVNTRIQMLKDGTVDTIALSPAQEPEVAGYPGISVVKGVPTYELTMGVFNFDIDSPTANSVYGGTITDDFFCDVHMRRAFTHLIDYAYLIQDQFLGNALQPNGPILLGMFGYDPTVPKYSYDLEAAKAEFQLTVNPMTGGSWWDSGFTIPLFFNAGNMVRSATCNLIKGALESLNPLMTATVNALDWPTYLSLLRTPHNCMPMWIIGWISEYADPDDIAVCLLDSAWGVLTPYTRYSNPAVDDLLRRAASELDPAVRQELYSELSMLVYDDVPYVWLAQAGNFFVERSWVNGYYFNPMYGGLYFASLWKDVPPVEFAKNAGRPADSAVSWTVHAWSTGTWSAEVKNNGLTLLALDVYDISTGEKVSRQQMNFRSPGAYPSGTLSSGPVPMLAGHTYKVVVTPIGKTGTSAQIVGHWLT